MAKLSKSSASSVGRSARAGRRHLRPVKAVAVKKPAGDGELRREKRHGRVTGVAEKLETNNDKKGNGGAAAAVAAFGVTPLRGLEKWLKEYQEQRPGPSALAKELDDYMAQYDAKIAEAAKERAERAAADEGWTLVVSKPGRKKNVDGSGVAVGAVAAAKAGQAQPKDKHVADFYRFQQREVQRNELLELQQKFAEDKRRIAKLKAARKFKPY